MKIFLACLAAMLLAFGASPQNVGLNPQGPSSAAQQVIITAPNTGSPVPGDPCLSNILKKSVSVAITSATTTQLVALASGQAIYVCGFLLTVSQVVTTANTIQFEYGTGTTCATGTTVLTGAMGTGGVTAGTPLVLEAPADGTDFTAPAGNALCAVTTIGASAAFEGVLSYVQQ